MTETTTKPEQENTLDDFSYALKHAESGAAEAQYHLALMYDTGRYVERSPSKARDWYTKAAEQGHSSAQYYLARMYESSDSGIEADESKAIYWYGKASENGHNLAKIKIDNLIY